MKSEIDCTMVNAMPLAEVERLADDEEGPLPGDWEMKIVPGVTNTTLLPAAASRELDMASTGPRAANLEPGAKDQQELIRAAVSHANAFLARYGLWSDGKRQF